ncbi:hypothetical protein C3747_21g366 [Trypanosoma cruzi]|uniref:Uncharacterized protein n=2 Tax=Trypanosoma cruzi TaxID=5693 RepID=Q4DIP3_TRYCC|nr:hypothetical protein, conserved [Trypanosoma cruzi]EAN92388.1 hypothetical protein, conserved [Trypanosoma cruzi]PWV16814.1 hypothetical protein C3747_21g366 [Trypanosoma cruzi]RNC46673.1 hypothetical protein TcCL_NonESM03542 [Trypanosoma cruzi]|eukprot:XP_814239.1 hypothetical protein [Trypanosoma cruzi strain CL Brener]
MDLGLHFMTREEAVVIFVDMDPSILLTDHALPYPLGAPVQIGGSSSSKVTDGSVEGAGTLGRMESAFKLPKARIDVIRLALSSFLHQKWCALSNSPKSLWFSLYAVRDDIIELLPPTRGEPTAIDATVKRHIRADAEPTALATAPCGSFPFCSVADVLQRTEEMLTSAGVEEVRYGGGDVSRRNSQDAGTGALKTPLLPQTAEPRKLMLIQGIVLLNRDSALPTSAPPTDAVGCELLGTGLVVRRFLDVIPLGSKHRPSPLLRGARDCHTTGVSHTETPKKGKEAPIPSKQTMVVECPCNIIDLVSFTGVSNRGLALGCALTKLLTPHIEGSFNFFSAQPLRRVNIALISKEIRRERQQQQQQQQQLEASARKGTSAPLEAKPEVRVERLPLDVKGKKSLTEIETGAPSQRPTTGDASCEVGSSLSLMTGTASSSPVREVVGNERENSDSLMLQLFPGVAVKEAPRVTSSSSFSPPYVRGVLLGQNLKERKP